MGITLQHIREAEFVLQTRSHEHVAEILEARKAAGFAARLDNR